MNRTERLYAVAELLRSAGSEPTSAADLATQLSVSTRTIERDITTLQEAGLAVQSSTGRHGGYTLVEDHGLSPLHITPAEAAAMALALARNPEGPLADAGRSARRKLMAAMAASDPQGARHLANRLQALGGEVAAVLQDAVADQQVVELRYRGPDGTVSARVVEPIGLITRHRVWYLVAWCRMADDHRSFRLDRLEEAVATGERAPDRDSDSDEAGRSTRLF